MDVLSRHVGTVALNGCLDKAAIIQGQARCAFCAKQNPRSYSSKSEFFLDDEGAMYRRQENGKHQFIIPKNLVQDVIKENHEPKFVTHPGIQRTYSLRYSDTGDQGCAKL
jgi:hypothetical protein